MTVCKEGIHINQDKHGTQTHIKANLQTHTGIWVHFLFIPLWQAKAADVWQTGTLSNEDGWESMLDQAKIQKTNEGWHQQNQTCVVVFFFFLYLTYIAGY